MLAASQASPMSSTATTMATTIPGTSNLMAIATTAAAVATIAASSHPRSDVSRSGIGFQPVADTPQRRDTQGAPEFPPQADDVDVDGLLTHEPRSPDLIEKLVPGVGASRATQERLQQVELPAGEVHPVAAEGAAPCPPVELDRTNPQRRGVILEPAGAAQLRPDPGDHLVRQERLDHVVVGTDFQASHPAGLFPPRGQEDDRDRGVPPGPPDHLEAVYLGQHHVDDGQIDMTTAQRGERLQAGACLLHREAGLHQVQAHEAAQG